MGQRQYYLKDKKRNAKVNKNLFIVVKTLIYRLQLYSAIIFYLKSWPMTIPLIISIFKTQQKDSRNILQQIYLNKAKTTKCLINPNPTKIFVNFCSLMS